MHAVFAYDTRRIHITDNSKPCLHTKHQVRRLAAEEDTPMVRTIIYPMADHADVKRGIVQIDNPSRENEEDER